VRTRQRPANSGTRSPRSFDGSAMSTATPAATSASASTCCPRHGPRGRPSSPSTTIRGNAWSVTSATSTSTSPTAAARYLSYWRPGPTPTAPSPWPCRPNAPRRSSTASSKPSPSSGVCRAKCGGTTRAPSPRTCWQAGRAGSTSATRPWPVTTPSRRCSAWSVSRKRSHMSKGACATCNATGPRRCPRCATWRR
jgi:hypothetical protein